MPTLLGGRDLPGPAGAGAHIGSIYNPPDDDEATQILRESLYEGMAASFIVSNGKNVMRGLTYNAENAIYNGIHILGYIGHPNQKCKIDDKTAPTARGIFKEYIEGTPMQKLCNSLNTAGYRASLTIKCFRRPRRSWKPTSVVARALSRSCTRKSKSRTTG